MPCGALLIDWQCLPLGRLTGLDLVRRARLPQCFHARPADLPSRSKTQPCQLTCAKKTAPAAAVEAAGLAGAGLTQRRGDS